MSRFSRELDELIRARYSLIYIVTWEEDRARRTLAHIGETQRKAVYEWSITDGLRRIRGEGGASEPPRERDPMKALNAILQGGEAGLYVLKDFHTYMEAPEVIRQLRDLASALRRTRKTVILLSPVLKLPTELQKAVTVMDMPLPGGAELGTLLQNTIGAGGGRRYQVSLTDADREALVKAAQGLTLTEAENAFAKAIVRDGKLDSADVQAVIDEKRQVIRKSGVLEYYDILQDMPPVGGMDILKDWLAKRVRAFSQHARDYGLPEPRGILLLGVQGCGKSLIAKTIAHSWKMPLLRMDMSRIFEGYIGSSEVNMRQAVRLAEGLAPVVLWIDEIEKAFSGVGGSGTTDAGTTARVVGTFLTWMQERTSPVFVVATANEVEGLPPELLRKGRLDEVFFVDLPRSRERAEIFEIHLTRRKRDASQFDLRALAEASDGYSGAELEQAIVSAMHDSYFADREVTTDDIMQALQESVPLSMTMREKILALRTWARDRARPVSSMQQLTGSEADHGPL